MKKLLTLLLLATLFVSCSSDDDDNEPQIAQTTFQIFNTEPIIYPNLVCGYINKANNKWVRIGKLGNMTSASDIIMIKNDTLKNIYLFFDKAKTYKLDTVFVLEKGVENKFYISNKTMWIEVDKDNEFEYPH